MKYLRGSLLYGDDEAVASLVASRIPHVGTLNNWGPHRAVGVVRRNKVIGGIVFHNFHGHTVEMSGAFDSPDWCYPATLRDLFAIPFHAFGVTNLLTVTGKKNDRARKLDKWLGFTEVGTVHRALDGKQDAVIYEMLRENCRWLRPLKQAEAA